VLDVVLRLRLRTHVRPLGPPLGRQLPPPLTPSSSARSSLSPLPSPPQPEASHSSSSSSVSLAGPEPALTLAQRHGGTSAELSSVSARSSIPVPSSPSTVAPVDSARPLVLRSSSTLVPLPLLHSPPAPAQVSVVSGHFRLVTPVVASVSSLPSSLLVASVSSLPSSLLVTSVSSPPSSLQSPLISSFPRNPLHRSPPRGTSVPSSPSSLLAHPSSFFSPRSPLLVVFSSSRCPLCRFRRLPLLWQSPRRFVFRRLLVWSRW